MSVYVDPISFRGYFGPKCFRDGSCHMWADTHEELHDMASRLGLKRGWFQDHPTLPHYDLTPARRIKAVKAGVLQVSLKAYLYERKKAKGF